MRAHSDSLVGCEIPFRKNSTRTPYLRCKLKRKKKTYTITHVSAISLKSAFSTTLFLLLLLQLLFGITCLLRILELHIYTHACLLVRRKGAYVHKEYMTHTLLCSSPVYGICTKIRCLSQSTQDGYNFAWLLEGCCRQLLTRFSHGFVWIGF